MRYVLPARILHWLMAVGFAFMWICGYTMTTLVEDDSPLEEFLFDLHISVGVTLLFLLAARVAVRIARRPPPFPEWISNRDQTLATIAHASLYALPMALIVFGWAEVNLGGRAVAWFGFEIPPAFPENEALEEPFEDLHKWTAYTMLCLAAVHVAAVGKHRWIDRQDILSRMTIGRRA